MSLIYEMTLNSNISFSKRGEGDRRLFWHT